MVVSPSFSPTLLQASSRAALGKVAVALQPSHSVHARFDHFVVAPATLGDAQASHAAGGSMTVNKILIWDRLVEILGPAAAGATPTDLAVAAPEHLDAAIETVRARLGQRGLLPEGGTFVNVFA